MTVKPWLERAGQFTLEHIGGIPHFNQAVDPDVARAAVLHTTEGGWDGSLGVFKRHYAPHFLVGPGRIAQLVQVGTIGAALVAHNWLALVQVEVVGFSKQTSWIFDDATCEAVAALMAACKAEYGIPLTRPWPDGVYGMARASDPHRNGGQFGKIPGWYGHGDVPSPDSHWDPGCLKWGVLFARAAKMPEANALPSTEPEIAAASVLRRDARPRHGRRPDDRAGLARLRPAAGRRAAQSFPGSRRRPRRRRHSRTADQGGARQGAGGSRLALHRMA